MEFEFTEFNDPAFAAILLPIVKEFINRSKLEISPEDYIRHLANALFTRAPVKIYIATEKTSGEIGAIAIVGGGGIPPRVWLEGVCQLRKYAKYQLAQELLKRVIDDMRIHGVSEIYCMTKNKALAKGLIKRLGFKPKEIILTKEIGGS